MLTMKKGERGGGRGIFLGAAFAFVPVQGFDFEAAVSLLLLSCGGAEDSEDADCA